MGKLTLENLLDRKSKQDKITLSTFEIENLNATLEIVKIKTRKILEIMDKYDENEGKVTSGYKTMCETIYKSVPMLQKEDLKSKLNVPTPYEVVEELFAFNEIEKIYSYIMELHGITDKKETPINDEIKN